MVSNLALRMSTLRQVLQTFEFEKLPLTGIMRKALVMDSFKTDQHIVSHVLNSPEEGKPTKLPELLCWSFTEHRFILVTLRR